MPLQTKTSIEIIAKLKNLFATHGIPETVVNDSMPLNSFECRNFANEWNFEFNTSSPRYPQSNGQAERAVQSAKKMMKMIKKCIDDNKDLELVLLEHRNSSNFTITNHF